MTAAPRIAEFLAALNQTQHLPPERLRLYQRRLLATLLDHARRQTDFYAERLAPLFRADGSVDFDRWQEVPVLSRGEVLADTAALTARSLPPGVGAARPANSSGSTGDRLTYRPTDLQNLATAACNERFFDWHGIDPAGLTAMIWGMETPEPPGQEKGRPPRPWRPLHPESRVTDLDIWTTAERQVAWLRQSGASCLSSYPTNLREIGLVASGEGAPLRFPAILSHGELLTEGTRRDIRASFGREPIDRYGTTEAGLVAASCPHSMKHHVSAEAVFLEIVDADGRAVDPGTAGRIVVTPLYGLAMPLIRYDTGDWGILAAGPCGCGRTLPLLDRILGRTRNRLRLADGRAVWPDLDPATVRRFVAARQFQFVQTSPDEVAFRYVPLDRDRPVDAAGLADQVAAAIGTPLKVTAVPVADMMRPENGKLDEWVGLSA